MDEIHSKEEDLKRQWESTDSANGVQVPIHQIQYAFDSKDRESAFIAAQFPTEDTRNRYLWYRNEWHRRAKQFDPGPAPLTLTCELTSTCNLACGMCYTITQEFQNIVTGAQRMMPWPMVKAIIDEAAEIGVCSILFSWRGESTLYRWRDGDTVVTFPDVLAYARRKGILEITSLTHGQLIDEAMANAIVDAGPNWISFSFDGIYEDYNRIRTPPANKDPNYDAFGTLVGNIQRLVAIRNAKGKKLPQIRSNTIFPAIASDPKGYQDFMREIGVDMITVNELLDLRDGEVPEDMIMENWACQSPFQRLTVSANGIILPCTGAHKEQTGLVLGRFTGAPPKEVRNLDGTVSSIEVPELSLAQAWVSPKVQQIRELHRCGRRTEIHPGCRHCNHGVKKFGAERMPDGWDAETQTWRDRKRIG
jgi:hypothetical protein